MIEMHRMFTLCIWKELLIRAFREFFLLTFFGWLMILGVFSGTQLDGCFYVLKSLKNYFNPFGVNCFYIIWWKVTWDIWHYNSRFMVCLRVTFNAESCYIKTINQFLMRIFWLASPCCRGFCHLNRTKSVA